MDEITSSHAFHFTDMIRIKPGWIASRKLSVPLIAAGTAEEPEWVLYAMGQQETISAETSPRSKFIHVLAGELHMTVDHQPCRLSPGASIIVPPGTWHEFAAHTGCKFLQISL